MPLRDSHHLLDKLSGVTVLAIAAALTAMSPLPAHATGVPPVFTVMRPVVDVSNSWLVKPGTGAGQAWAAIDDAVVEPTAVPGTDWLWAGGAGRVAEVGLSYPAFSGQQPMGAAVKFYANTGASAQLRVETVACGTVRAAMTVPAGQGFAWRSFNTNPAKLYCGPTGQDQRLRLRFTTIGGGDSNVRAAYVHVALAASEKVANVMAYNIQEHSIPGTIDPVARTIESRNPDIVLLNEVNVKNIYLQAGFHPVDYLARRLGYPYWHYQSTTNTGVTGTKGVAILSRFALLQTRYYQVEVGGCNIFTFCKTFGILQATMNIQGVQHEVFSLRFAPQHPLGHAEYHWSEKPGNRAGHELLRQLVRAVPMSHRVIVGGDFNADWDTSPWSTEFRDTSGLKDSLVEYERPYGGSWNGRADYIYFRGPYVVKQAALQYGYAGASEHQYALATLGVSQAAAEEMANSGGGSMDY
jgi:endonuclease/exonuclease/phosphatase family metal-dependent hydrolase